MADTPVQVFNPEDMKAKLKDIIKGAMFGLLPDEALEKMATDEMEAFFKSEQQYQVQQIEVQVPNPAYDPKRPDYEWNNKKYIPEHRTVLSTRATPFRQMVWSILHEHLWVHLNQIIDAKIGQDVGELKFLMDQVGLVVGSTHENKFIGLLMQMVAAQYSGIIASAAGQAKMELLGILHNNGIQLKV